MSKSAILIKKFGKSIQRKDFEPLKQKEHVVSPDVTVSGTGHIVIAQILVKQRGVVVAAAVAVAQVQHLARQQDLFLKGVSHEIFRADFSSFLDIHKSN